MDFHELICMLLAIANYAKDIHYNCSGSAAYSKHLFADLLQDDVYDKIDQIKENVILGQKELPKSSKEYMEGAIGFIPDTDDSDFVMFTRILALMERTREGLKKIETPTRGAASLVDSIGEHLDKCCGLLFLQTRNKGLTEEYKKEDCEGAKETPVDRKEVKAIYPDGEKIAKTVLDYEAQNLLVAEEESALDRVSKKLGLE